MYVFMLTVAGWMIGAYLCGILDKVFPDSMKEGYIPLSIVIAMSIVGCAIMTKYDVRHKRYVSGLFATVAACLGVSMIFQWGFETSMTYFSSHFDNDNNSAAVGESSKFKTSSFYLCTGVLGILIPFISIVVQKKLNNKAPKFIVPTPQTEE